MVGLEVRDPVIGYAFTIENFTIRNTRAPHQDTDVVIASLKVDERMLPVLIKPTGDVNNGDHPLNMTVFPAIAVGRETKLCFSYVILNNGAAAGHGADLQIALNLLADVVGDSINAILDAAVIGSAVADLLKILIGLGTANCDGIVAIDTFRFTGADLHNFTQAGTVSYSPDEQRYPGNLPLTSDAYKRIYESNAGCGSNSDYSVRWHVRRAALADSPEVTTDRSAGAVISAGEPMVVVTDRYGTVWAQKHDSSHGWLGFRNLGLPPGTVAAGRAPVVLGGSNGTGAVDVFVVGAPQTGADANTTGQTVFALRESSGGTWTWIGDHMSPPGDQAAPDPSVVAAPAGPTMAFVIGEHGQLWERQLASDWLEWRPHGSPDGTILVPGWLSAVIDATGLVRVFAIGQNQHVYQLVPSQGPTWHDLGSPRVLPLVGPPSFAATQGFIVGLMHGWGAVNELSSRDGGQFAWTEHDVPLTSLDDTVVGTETSVRPSLIANHAYVGALVVDHTASLYELYRTDDDRWHWVTIGPAMGRWGRTRVPISNPCYVGVADGYRRGFVNGLDGHLYEASVFGTGHDWTWTDHST
jgi:hypothetical protein